MKKTNVQFLTKTAMLLALTVVFQLIGTYLPKGVSNFVVGPLVNASLLIATALAGVWSGLFIALVAPFTSLLLNHIGVASVQFFFSPVIVIGNALFVLAFHLFRNKSKVGGIAVGTAVKFGVLYGGILGFYRLAEATGFSATLGAGTPAYPVIKTALIAAFGYPQIITALLGGAIALAAIKLLDRQFKVR